MNNDMISLAEHHERQGLLYAEAATCTADWYKGQAADTRRAAEHFTVAASLRARALSTVSRGEVIE